MLKSLKIKSVKDAEKAMLEIGVSSEGISMMKKKAVHKVIKLKDINIKAANILKQQILSLGGDLALPKKACMLEGEKTDAILMGTLKQIENLISVLEKQPFGLKELGEKLKKELEL
jgi:dihydropteroate synthase